MNSDILKLNKSKKKLDNDRTQGYTTQKYQIFVTNMKIGKIFDYCSKTFTRVTNESHHLYDIFKIWYPRVDVCLMTTHDMKFMKFKSVQLLFSYVSK